MSTAARQPGQEPADYVDLVRQQWAGLFPGLDTSTVAIFGRISRITQIAQTRSDAVLAANGLSRAEFDVLSLLARRGSAQAPTQVAQELLISGAGATKRLKNLQSAGLIERTANPDDGRGSLIHLTAKARDLLGPILESVLAFEDGLLAELEPAARDELASHLQRLLASLEPGPENTPTAQEAPHHP